MWRLELADASDLAWAQQQVVEHHYLHTPVDTRCSVLSYVVRVSGERVGCLIFGRPEATRCYDGNFTYGSQIDVASGRARFDRWEVINLARVWMSEDLRSLGRGWLGTWAISRALHRLPYDYLVEFPPCFLSEPWRLRACLSYCDTRVHTGALYRAAGFQLARINANGIQTWWRPLRGLQGHERKTIERLAQQSYRSRVYRSQRLVCVDQHQLFQEERTGAVSGRHSS